MPSFSELFLLRSGTSVYDVQSASGISVDFIYRGSDVCLPSERMEKNIKTESACNAAGTSDRGIIKPTV